MTSSKSALSIAAVAAVMALTSFAASAPASAQQAKDAKVAPCYGVNSCKGMSDCKSGKHDCKGQGFKDLTAKACTAQGGSLTAPKA